MNKHEEVWDTIHNEVAYLHNGSLDARKGSLAEQVADTLTPFVEDMLREAQAKAWIEGKTAAVNAHPSWWGTLDNPYRGDSNV